MMHWRKGCRGGVCRVRGERVLSAVGVVPACPTLPLPRVAGRRSHACDMTTERSSWTTGGGSRRPDLSAAGPQRATSWRDRCEAKTTTRQHPRLSHLRRHPGAAHPRRVQGLACNKATDRCQRGWHVSGGDSHGRIRPQGGHAKGATTTSRKGRC